MIPRRVAVQLDDDGQTGAKLEETARLLIYRCDRGPIVAGAAFLLRACQGVRWDRVPLGEAVILDPAAVAREVTILCLLAAGQAVEPAAASLCSKGPRPSLATYRLFGYARAIPRSG